MADDISLPAIPWQTIMINNKTEAVRGCLKSSEKTFLDVRSSQLRDACAELESLFMYYLFKEMRATVPQSGFMSGGKGEQIYTSMLDMQLAKELSLKGGIGLASVLANQLAREDVCGESSMKNELD